MILGRRASHHTFIGALASGLWLGASARQGQRYANGEQAITTATTKLLRLVIRLGLEAEDVTKKTASPLSRRESSR